MAADIAAVDRDISSRDSISKETAVHPVLCFDPDPVDRKGISVVIQRKLWIHRHKTASFRAFLLLRYHYSLLVY